MFVIRRAKPDDTGTLLKLAKMVHFINLPADRQIIDQKVAWSRQCFVFASENRTVTPAKRAKPPAQLPARTGSDGALGAGLRDITGRSPVFVFVMEEHPESHSGASGVVGTSQIIAQISSPGQPNLSLELRRIEKFSQSLQMGVSHVMARLHLDEDGPTEVGGLILLPSYRGHRAKLGRFLSLVRFHFMGLHREFFSPRVLAEMMGPVNSDGQSPFWDGFTRAFINMSYEDADRFCQESKEFILSLFPREEIYLTLIAPEARACVAQVSSETVPARRMLEKLGFTYRNRIDPFDGGPHLECALDAISIVKDTRVARLADPSPDDKPPTQHAIVSVIDDDGEFRAVECPASLDRQGRLVIPRGQLSALLAEPGLDCGFTFLEPPQSRKPTPPTKATAASPAEKPAPAAAKPKSRAGTKAKSRR